MPVEEIKQQIREDAEKEINLMQNETKEKTGIIIAQFNKETKQIIQEMQEKGEQEHENIKRIRISQAHQEAKRKQMHAKEVLIETCFTQALEHLKKLDDKHYEKIINQLIQKGSKQINNTFYIKASKPRDKTIAKTQNISVKGTIEASGGIQLISENGNITIDNTFEGILKRKKQHIREQVGNMLFS